MFVCCLVVISDDSASSEGEIEFCYSDTDTFTQLFLRYSYFAAPGVPHRFEHSTQGHSFMLRQLRAI